MKRSLIIGLLLTSLILVSGINGCSEKASVQGDLNCTSDSGCIIRENNYGKTMVCNVNDINCINWSKTIESGSPGHGEYPRKGDLIASCNKETGICERKYDCSKCDEFKQRWGNCTEYLAEGKQGALYSVCLGYQSCNC